MEDSEIRLSDTLTDNNSPATSTVENAMNDIITFSLKDLSTREEKILRLKYGIK
jgi:DNA-directed RNA polymerase sigma subunit (sigma70/sigma32)